MKFCDKVLADFKLNIGDLDEISELDREYRNFINLAISDLYTDAISDSVMQSELGKYTIILYATLLLEKKDIATNPTITLLRNKLADMSAGEFYYD